MARDRLAVLRVRPFDISKRRSDIFTHNLSRPQAQRQGEPQSSTNANLNSEYEMSGLQTQDRITNGGRASSSDGMTRFYNQVRSRQNRYHFMFLTPLFSVKRYPVSKTSSEGLTRMCRGLPTCTLGRSVTRTKRSLNRMLPPSMS